MIYLSVPSLPPSANKAYFNQRGGRGRVLTKAGKRYKTETSNHLTRTYPTQLQYFKKDFPYLLVIQFVFGDQWALLTKGYPEKASSRYKKLDVGNRLKLFEDALALSTGCDDSQHWQVMVCKTYRAGGNYTHVWAWNMQDEPNNPISAWASWLLNSVYTKQNGAVSAVPQSGAQRTP